jgi:hypothetical protein
MPPLEAPPPKVPPELVIKYRDGTLCQHLVLRVQDTGGQPVFLSILELLTTPQGTVYLVVFSLLQLRDDFAHCVQSTVEQLQSIQLFAPDAPVVLAGTHKEEALDGRHPRTLKVVNDRLLAELHKQCAPAISGLQTAHLAGVGELCFFPLENSKGYHGDESIRSLVAAIEKAAHSLPSMNQRVPLRWLRVLDELRTLTRSERTSSLSAVCELAQRHGLPHPGLDFELEMRAMLSFFHSLNAVLWYDTPRLRELVVLDVQWVMDAASCFIRDHEMRDHTVRHEQMAAIPSPVLHPLLSHPRPSCVLLGASRADGGHRRARAPRAGEGL